jgi:hypothetical protein
VKKIFFFFATCSLLLATCYSQASAHIGGGPPFLVINGVYAATNPYYFNDPTIHIPQDYTGKTYLVNTPISLFVDLKQLLVPPDIAAQSTFRWTFAEGNTHYAFGTKLEHTYTKPGSYILSLEVKAPGETEYTLIDTVELDVLPNPNYQLPKATMAVETNHRQNAKPILFRSNFSVDPSTTVSTIIWGFGDGTIAKEKDVLHTYTNIQDYSTFPVIFRVTDAHGFRGYAGIIVEATKGTLHFVDNLGRENTIPVKDSMTTNSSQENKDKPVLLPVIIWVIIFVMIIGVLFGMIKLWTGRRLKKQLLPTDRT